MTRLAVTTGLDAWDIPALRFGVAGLILLPIVMRRGLAFDRLRWSGLTGLIVGTGAPYAPVVAMGLRFAPAYDAGALDHLRSADVPGVDDVVGPCELVHRLGAQKTVRIGDYADPHQTPAVRA